MDKEELQGASPEASPEPAQGAAAKPDFVDQLEELRKNTVDRKKYDEVMAENDKMRKALIRGSSVEDEAAEKSVNDLRKEYAEGVRNGMTNVKGFDIALKLRDAVIKETGKDPFMSPAMKQVDPTFGKRVADNLQNIVKESRGNPTMFNAILSQSLSEN